MNMFLKSDDKITPFGCIFFVLWLTFFFLIFVIIIHLLIITSCSFRRQTGFEDFSSSCKTRRCLWLVLSFFLSLVRCFWKERAFEGARREKSLSLISLRGKSVKKGLFVTKKRYKKHHHHHHLKRASCWIELDAVVIKDSRKLFCNDDGGWDDSDD